MSEGENWLRFAREDLRMVIRSLNSLSPSDLHEVKEIVGEIQGRIARFRKGNPPSAAE